MLPDQQHIPPPATPGDPLPNLVLPNALGDGIGLSQQQNAGRWQVLLFLDPADLTARTDAIEAARKRIEAIEGLLFVVGLTAPDPTRVSIDLFDESGRASEFLCNTKGGIAVISPEARLALQLPIDELEKAAAHCEKQFAKQTATILSGFAPALVIEDIFEPEFCEEVISFWRSAPKTKDEVASANRGNEYAIAEIKRRTDAVVPDGALFEGIKNRIGRRVLPQIERAFKMKVASMEALRIGCYASENKGAFGRHRDNTTPFTAHRRFAMTLNLNAGDYDGGQLRFPEYGRALYQPPTGGGVIFSCSMLHEALPVTSGERFAIFTFFTDASGLEQEKQMRSQMAAQQGAAQI